MLCVFLYLSISLNMSFVRTYVLVELRNVCLSVSLSLYKFKNVFVSTIVLVEFRKVCLCFVIHLSV